MMNSADGLLAFIDKANIEINAALSTYEMNRKYSKNQEEALNKANESLYKAIKDRDFFTDLYNRCSQGL